MDGNFVPRLSEIDDWSCGAPSQTIVEPKPPVTFRVELVSSRDLGAIHTAWADLCGRALETNVFLEPAFALPLMQHVRQQDRPDILLVWEENGPLSFARLVGLFPLRLPRRSLLRGAHGYQDKQIALGTPLFDAHRAEEAFDAVLAWLRDRGRPLPCLILSAIATDGPFHALLMRMRDRHDLQVRNLTTDSRAILRKTASIGGVDRLVSAKQQKEWRRQARRLSEVGTRTYVSAQSPKDIARAVERFLALEHNGWKGGRSTSLLADPKVATFTRTMCRLMAYDGKCRIDSLEIDGKAVAMGIVLIVGDRAHFWKTAFDERFAAWSPGVQFANELTERLRADPMIAAVDSCAKAGHPMIDRLWPERLEMTDLMMGTIPGDTFALERTWRLEMARRALRAAAKHLAKRLLRRAH